MDFLSSIIGAMIGGALGVITALFSTFYGPKEYEKWKEKNRNERDILPRKQLLKEMLENEKFKDGRKLSTLMLVTGTSKKECRNLLIQIKARGVILKENGANCEGWALITNKPLIER
jgi:hypothetical protein